MHVYLQHFVSNQPRTSPPKIRKILKNHVVNFAKMLEGTTVVRGDPLHRRPAQLVGRQALEGQAGEGVPAAQRLRPARQT